jgi:hypothetical protein
VSYNIEASSSGCTCSSTSNSNSNHGARLALSCCQLLSSVTARTSVLLLSWQSLLRCRCTTADQAAACVWHRAA